VSRTPPAAARLRAVAFVAAFGVALGLPVGGGQAQTPVPAAPVVIDGPSPDIVGLSGLAVARDGGGGIVYLKQVLGVTHVFVSQLNGGVFQPPEQLDTSLIGDSSQPVIAAGNGGLLLVAFINGGQLYVVDRPSASAPYGELTPLASAASNPAISLSNFGKGYLAFTEAGAGGGDVRTAYYYKDAWAIEPTPLDAVADDDAGTGSGRPAVAAAGDGVGIVAWGEAGHIYSRRMWGASPSVVFEQADVPSLSGASEVSADLPVLATGGDSSYADVVFHEVLASGLQKQSRVLMRRLRGSQYEPVTQPDGVSGAGPGGADDPMVVTGEFGHGLITSAHDDSNELFATLLGTDGAGDGTLRVDSLQNDSAPDAVPAMAGANTDLIAWQEDAGAGAQPEIRVRYSPDGLTFGPELVISSPALGPTDAPTGLQAAGDYSGNAAVAWAQGTGDSTRIVADQLYEPPGSFSPSTKFRYVRSVTPVLTWSQPREHWGPMRYAVTIDGTQAFQTGATSLRVPATLGQGPHTWLVTATNPAGQAVTTKAARIWVDTLPPAVTFSLRGTRRVGRVQHLYVVYTDSPVAVPAGTASGTASVLVKWGDGSSGQIHHASAHTYARAAHYTLKILVTDHAGNRTTVVRTIKIAPKPKPKPKKKKKGKRPSPTKHHTARN
jgi:hypothetical protein